MAKQRITLETPEPDPVKVRFLENYTVQDGTGDTYEAGKVYELKPDSADHFVRRNVAQRLDGRSGPASVEEPEPVRDPSPKETKAAVAEHEPVAEAAAHANPESVKAAQVAADDAARDDAVQAIATREAESATKRSARKR